MRTLYISWKSEYRGRDLGTVHTAYIVKAVRGQDGKRRYPIYAKLGNLCAGANRSDFIQSAIFHINDVFQDIRSIGCKAEERDSLRSRLIGNLSKKVDQILGLPLK